LIDPQLPVNEGLLRVIDFKVRDGSLLNPRYPAPLNTYNPAVSAMIDAVFEALSETVPDRKRADGCGSGSITLGGRKPGSDKSYIQYELFGGGGGGRSGKDGDSGTSVNHLNSKIAPVEIIESEFPVRLLRYDLINESGGAGCYRGGLGILREYLILGDAKLMLRSSKHLIPPSGIDGGKPGRPGMVLVNSGTNREETLPTRCEHFLEQGDILRIERPGGGGFGDPFERDPGKILQDIEDGYVSLEGAARDYGVVVRRLGNGFELDAPGTEALRTMRRKTANATTQIRQPPRELPQTALPER
ncbi:MAG: hydantoinase B/oxoprolinase family protein, partial [Deltaproteobacteria bacterium]|nr:hydantoinase B/oxoprolinase family protein [Deltaproteobacteria bacterium]